jgi:adenosylcobyric acid synthase
MLGQTIADPDGIEGAAGTSEGLGLLDVKTILGPSKQLRLEDAKDARFNKNLSGYHMHMGKTIGPDCNRPFACVGEMPEGAISPDGLVMGTYLHGLFSADEFRQSFVADLVTDFENPASGAFNYENEVENILDQLAAHLEQHLDLDSLLDLARPPKHGA